MEIYLIRHTTPLVEKGICYGQTDLDITDSFEEEVDMIRPHIPSNNIKVYSSPLQRCKKLAAALYHPNLVECHADLMELNCGDWEMQKWDDIPKAEIQPWMDDFVNVTVPNGESYVTLHQRVVNPTPLKESFDAFTLHYGCVVKINVSESGLAHELLYNYSRQGKEWHRPTKN
ncbi:MAG: phosphoglycerate mutase [Chitinophagaceae bacterium]|nr:MAG: phosphoglycerate mutase [Chitinophagaceae bacterium]